jgi:uncharacterized protein (TIGR02271 family)
MRLGSDLSMGQQVMIECETFAVNGPEGRVGTIVVDPTETQPRKLFSVRLRQGEQVFVPEELLERRADGSYFVPGGLQTLLDRQVPISQEEPLVVPLAQERLRIGVRRIETGKVVITKSVREREQVVDEPVIQEHAEIERVAVNRFIDSPVSVREEGDLLIVPVMEEVLVVEKRLLLKEELRIRRRRVETRQSQRVVLRTEEAQVEHFKHVHPS